MIGVAKDYRRPPDVLCGPKFEAKTETLLTTSEQRVFDKNLYRHKTVKNALYRLYRQKCGYCESKTLHGGPLEVEHYRPKASVAQDNASRGYYWLAYEWSNLLLSCSMCNRHKGHRFPISGKRMLEPPERAKWRCDAMRDEQPLLLNPEIDDPVAHLTYAANGLVVAIEENPRGRASIDTCKLNRQYLIAARRQIVESLSDSLYGQLIRLLALLKRIKVGNTAEFDELLRAMFFECFGRLWQGCRPEHEFSAFSRYLYDHFDEIFANRIANHQHRVILKKAFGLFRARVGER